MKPLQSICFGLLLMLGCRDTAENNVSDQNDRNKLNAAVGREIPLDIAQQWIANYKKKDARVMETSYRVDAVQLQNLMQAVPDPLGIIFHYATDDSGDSHILVISLDENAPFWTASSVVVDANTNAVVDAIAAKTWAKRYRAANPNGVWHHSFGINMFRSISSNPGFQYFDVSPALNEIGSQLVLMVWNNTTNSREGKSNTGRLTAVAYDDSFRCPPTCNPINFND
jgi:hypothetical protein